MGAVKLLSREFGADQSARAALEYALGNDTSPQVKTLARWEFLDEDGRRAYVRNTLLNSDLSAAERFELLVADINDLHSYVDRQSASAALSAALQVQRSRGAATTASARESEAIERMLPLLIGALSDQENEQLRSAAAALLVEHVADPRVRAAFEQAVSVERSFVLRSQLGGALRIGSP
jgi:hypothetical protein